jgi:hypothetical protein
LSKEKEGRLLFNFIFLMHRFFLEGFLYIFTIYLFPTLPRLFVTFCTHRFIHTSNEWEREWRGPVSKTRTHMHAR